MTFHEELESVGLRETAKQYGIATEGMTTVAVIEAVEEAGRCDVESVISAVLGGAYYPVFLPGMTEAQYDRLCMGV